MTLNFSGLDEDEALVWGVLQGCVGKRYAVTQHLLEEVTRIPARRVRMIIESLIHQHKKVICSSYDRDRGGYYLPENESEVRETCEKLHGHALRILTRESVLKKLTLRELLKLYQKEIPFNDLANTD